MAVQRYMHVHGVPASALADVCVSIRQHAELNPKTISRSPLTVDDHQNSK